MADVALVAGGVETTPLEYTIPGAQEIIPKACTAAFDGSSAAGDFVPTLLIKAPNGKVLAACPVTSTVAAGASADVSWFPRGGVSQGAGGGNGIQFTADGVYGAANTGDALAIESDGPGTTVDGYGVSIVDTSDNGINLERTSGSGVVQLKAGTSLLGLDDNGNITGVGETGFVIPVADAIAFKISDPTHGTLVLIDNLNHRAWFTYNNLARGLEVTAAAATLFDTGNSVVVSVNSIILNVATGKHLFVVTAAGITLTIDGTTGAITPLLPTSAGVTGTLWNNAGVVSVSP